jgi:hypothetical protein
MPNALAYFGKKFSNIGARVGALSVPSLKNDDRKSQKYIREKMG